MLRWRRHRCRLGSDTVDGAKALIEPNITGDDPTLIRVITTHDRYQLSSVPKLLGGMLFEEPPKAFGTHSRRLLRPRPTRHARILA